VCHWASGFGDLVTDFDFDADFDWSQSADNSPELLND